MLLLVSVPHAWFNDEMSFALCDELQQPRIRANQWVDLLQLYSLQLPDNFDLSLYLERDKLDGIIFTYGEENRNVLLHRKKVFKLVARALRKTIKRETH